MSETHLDALLDELVPAEPRERWEDVVHRARRSRRRYVALVVAFAVLVLAPATWAAVKAFEGTPASAVVKQDFQQMNDMLAQGQLAAAHTGLSAQIPQADINKAHGVLQVQTPYGPLDLWVAPYSSGKGRCWFLGWERELTKPQGFGGGTCTNPAVPSAGISVGPQWDASHPSVSVLYGSVSGPETTLDVKLKDGRTVILPVVEHLALGIVPGGDLGSHPIVSFTGRDASGNVVESVKPVGSKLPAVVAVDGARRVALHFRQRWLKEIAQRAKGDPTQRFANLSEADFRTRLEAAANRYGFTVKSVQFLHPRQAAPLVVVRTASGSLAKPFVVGNIFSAIDPAKIVAGQGVRPFEALFFEAQDEHGIPYLIAQNEERNLNSGIPDGGGISWTREPMNGPLGMIG